MSLPFGTFDPAQKITLLSVGGQSFQGWDIAPEASEVREVWARERTQNKGKVRIVLDNWNNRIPFIAAMLGGTLQTSGGAQYRLSLAYPDFKAWICHSIEVRQLAPQGVGPNGIIAGLYADLTMNFGPPDYTPFATNGLGVAELDVVSNAISLDQTQSSFKYTSDGVQLPPSAFPALRFTTVSVRLPRIDLPALPLSTVMSLVDHSNNATFLGQPAETVTLRGAKSKWKLTAGQIVNFDADFFLEIHSVSGGWNKTYRPNPTGSGGWVAFTDLQGNKLFPPVDYSPLVT